VVDAGGAVCVRCGYGIAPGERFHLDHADDKIHYLGVSHPRCNVVAAARLGSRRAREKKQAAEGWPAPRASRASRAW
jgi:hypothetical protein